MKVNLRIREFFTGLDKKEIIICLAEGLVICGVFGFFFYKSFIWTLILLPLSIPIAGHKAAEMKKSKNRNLLIQFRELVVSVSGSMQAGYSMENAFRESVKDMIELYGKESAIVIEIRKIVRGLDNNGTLTEMLYAFAGRTGLDEIENFTEIIAVGKNTGGNVMEITASYIRMIDEKMDVLQEIETMTAARKYEQKIMNAIPFVILLYMETTSRGFFSMLYHNIFGNIVMSVNLALYILAVRMSEKIVNIEI